MHRFPRAIHLPLAAGLSALVALCCLAAPTQAAIIQVAQESAPGAGDFDANVLGTIVSFDTPLSPSDFYAYGSSSYNGETNGGPTPVSGLSQIFMVNSASDGLSLFVVHDMRNDNSGGTTETQWNLTGDTAAFMLVDDPGETASVSAGGTQFNSTKNWIACCTDGYVIGALDHDWEMFGQFVSSPAGIDTWSATSSGSTSHTLVIEPGRRVRLKASTIPEPTSSIVFGGLFSLVGLACFRRRRSV